MTPTAEEAMETEKEETDTGRAVEVAVTVNKNAVPMDADIDGYAHQYGLQNPC